MRAGCAVSPRVAGEQVCVCVGEVTFHVLRTHTQVCDTCHPPSTGTWPRLVPAQFKIHILQAVITIMAEAKLFPCFREILGIEKHSSGQG